MKKSFVLCLFCCLALVLLGACGGGADGGSTAAETSAVTSAPQESTAATEPEQSTAAQSTAAEETQSAVEPQPEPGEKIVPLALAVYSNRVLAYAEDDAIISYVDVPSVMLAEGAKDYYAGAAEYPALDKALSGLNSALAAYADGILDEITDWAASDYKDADADDRQFFTPLCMELTLYTQRADSRMLSLLAQDYSNTGGPHPNTLYMSYNFDTESGAELKLEDVFTDRETLAKLVVSELRRLYPDTYFFEDMEKHISEGVQNNELCWVMDQQGVCFYFSPYELAAYAEGTLTARIGFDAYGEIFNEKYFSVPETYARQLLPYINYSLDTDGDGKQETLYLYYEADEEDVFFYGSANILFNGDQYVERGEFVGFDAYLVYADGWYVYLFASEMNDYRNLYVYALDKKGVNFCGLIDGTGLHFYDTDGAYGWQVLTAPEYCRLDTRVEMLSTMDGWCDYTVDKRSGLPQMSVPYYTLENDFVLTLKQDIELPPAEGTEALLLKQGDTLRFVRSDAVNYVDMRTQDGRVCRISPQFFPDDGAYRVNGIDINALFDGMMFAG